MSTIPEEAARALMGSPTQQPYAQSDRGDHAWTHTVVRVLLALIGAAGDSGYAGIGREDLAVRALVSYTSARTSLATLEHYRLIDVAPASQEGHKSNIYLKSPSHWTPVDSTVYAQQEQKVKGARKSGDEFRQRRTERLARKPTDSPSGRLKVMNTPEVAAAKEQEQETKEVFVDTDNNRIHSWKGERVDLGKASVAEMFAALGGSPEWVHARLYVQLVNFTPGDESLKDIVKRAGDYLMIPKVLQDMTEEANARRPVKEATDPEPVKEATVEPVKETSVEPVKEASVEPEEDVLTHEHTGEKLHLGRLTFEDMDAYFGEDTETAWGALQGFVLLGNFDGSPADLRAQFLALPADDRAALEPMYSQTIARLLDTTTAA